MLTPLISMFLPTKGRGEQALRCINRVLETTNGFDLELFIIAHPEEGNEILKTIPVQPNRVGKTIIHLEYMDIKPIPAGNWAAERAIGTHFLDFDDDAWFYENWLVELFKVFDSIPNGYGYVKMASESQNYWAEKAMGNRQFYIDVLGGVVAIPHYYSQYNDVEKSDRAISAGVFFNSNAYVEHRHWAYGKAEQDATYLNGGMKYANVDGATYQMRKAAGFPNDYEAVIK